MKAFTDPIQYFWWLSRLLFTWVLSKLTTDSLRERSALAAETPVLYVLPKRSLSDFLVLYHHCKALGLPLPRTELSDLKKGGQASFFAIDKPGMFQRKRSKNLGNLPALVARLQKDGSANIQIVPVSVLWGRNPGKGEKSLFKLFFSDDENAGTIQKLFIVLAQGRNNFVHFGQPISLRELVDEGASVEQTARKLRRVLRVHFIRQRNAILGHKLYVREQVVSRIVRARPVQEMIAEESRKKKVSKEKLEKKAAQMTREISADVTWPVVRMFEVLLTRLWNRIFDGVVIRHFEQIKEYAQAGYEIVYVPNHRSHMDYLVVNYSIFKGDLPSTHTAAGINLNFWPVGPLLRRGGAFFLRRKFSGDRLYTAVFSEYLHYLLVHGYPVTFFPEGGRSRTGLLLAPKTGMLAMVVQSFLRDRHRPIVFVPISINYDKVVEVRSYLKELSGTDKRKESMGQLLKARKILKSHFGKAYIGFGEPVSLSEYLDTKVPGWQDQAHLDGKPPWMSPVVGDLAMDLTVRINQAVIVSPVSLIALALLSCPQRAMPEDELLAFLDKMRQLYRAFPYSDRAQFPEGEMSQFLREAEKLDMFQRFTHVGGDVIYLNELQAILMSYYRNNILHLIALPSLIARFFQHREEFSEARLSEACLAFFPVLEDHFFLAWDEGLTLETIVKRQINAMVEVGLLKHDAAAQVYRRPNVASPEFENLRTLGRALGLVFERSLITVSLLAKSMRNGPLDRTLFEGQCQKMAQRLAILNGVQTPETLDRSIFKNQVNLLKKLGYVSLNEEDRLIVDQRVVSLAEMAAMLLSADVRHSIERISISIQG